MTKLEYVVTQISNMNLLSSKEDYLERLRMVEEKLLVQDKLIAGKLKNFKHTPLADRGELETELRKLASEYDDLEKSKLNLKELLDKIELLENPNSLI